MTTSGDPEAHEATTEDVEPEKTAVRHEAVTMLGTDLSDRDDKQEPGPPVDLFNESPEQVFVELLEQIWAKTHQDHYPTSETGDEAAAWRVVRSALVNTEDIGLIGETLRRRVRNSASARGTADRGIDGDSRTVAMVVRSAASGMTRDELPGFIQTILLPTITRLEREPGEGPEKREHITDAVVAVLLPLRGIAEHAEIDQALFGYLTARGFRADPGFWLTVAQTGTLRSEVGPTWRHERAYIFLYTLWGVRQLIEEPGHAEFSNSPLQRLVANAAGSAASTLWGLQRAESTDTPAANAALPGGEVVRTLILLSAVTAAERSQVPESLATQVLTELGTRTDAPLPMLAAIDTTGSLADIWLVDDTDRARLEAASAVGDAAAGAGEYVASGLRNACISLRRGPEAASPTAIHSRLVLNALGLRWALHFGGKDLQQAMWTMQGLDTTVVLLRDVIDYQQAAGTRSDIWPAVEHLARLLIALPGGLGGSPFQAEFAQIKQAAGNLELTPDPSLGTDQLARAVADVLEALRPAGQVAATDEDMDGEQVDVVDSARLVRLVFEDLLGRESWAFQTVLDGITQRRQDPVRVLRETYPRTDHPLDGGPLAALELPGFDVEQWRSLAEQLHRDPGSLVPYLRRLPADVTAARQGT